MSSLMATLGETGCHFVRCLNPNNLKKKGKFDDEYIGGQLRAGGIVAALEVIKKGFPTRCVYSVCVALRRVNKTWCGLSIEYLGPVALGGDQEGSRRGTVCMLCGVACPSCQYVQTSVD